MRENVKERAVPGTSDECPDIPWLLYANEMIVFSKVIRREFHSSIACSSPSANTIKDEHIPNIGMLKVAAIRAWLRTLVKKS